VLSFIFLVAILNLGLGYVAAIALVEPPLWSGLSELWRRRKDTTAEELALLLDAAEDTTGPAVLPEELVANASAAAVAGIEELPEDWLAQLAAEGIVAQTFVEASAHVLRLEVGRYREQLIATEIRTRGGAELRDAEALKRLIDDLRVLNQDWLDKQTAAADTLTQRAGRLGDHEKAAESLEQVLLDQAAQIRSACAALESLDPAAEAVTGSKKLLEQIATLLVHAHALRDGMLELLATLLRSGQSLQGFAPAIQGDPVTGLPNRVGLDLLLAGWFANDDQRTRPLSAILIDVDRFGRINQRFGTPVGDRTIAAIGRLIEETLVKDRGFERLVRVSGEAFMLLQGDVGPHQALTAAERLRQSIEATTFDDDSREFDLTVSCGVIEVKTNESSVDLVRRCIDTLKFAKKAGRNRCALDKGDGPTMLDPPQFPVKGRVVSLAAGAVQPATTPPATSTP
jgi:diguanylate cyclase